MTLHSLRVIKSFTQANWQVNLQYRFGAVMWAVNGLITPIVLMVVWIIVAGNKQMSLSQSQVFTYYIISMLIFRLTQSWIAEDLTFTIREGRFAKYLIRPLPFLYEWIAKDIALRIIRITLVIPLILVVVNVMNRPLALQLNVFNLSIAIFAISLGYLTNLFIESIVGISTFWLDDAYGTFLLLMLVRDMFSGILIPLMLMPQFLRQLSIILPFYLQLGFPIDVLMGTLPSQSVIQITLRGVLWVVGLYVFLALYLRSTIKKYSAEGI